MFVFVFVFVFVIRLGVALVKDRSDIGASGAAGICTPVSVSFL